MSAKTPATQVIPGFQLLEKLGQGGMGAVYKARQESMDRVVALKILPKSLAKRTEFKERFFREARAAGKLNHQNIVGAIDAREANGYCYIAMEFVEGETVAAKLKREGALPEAEAVRIALQIANALAHAWKAGIVHRDVKPENFLYTPDGVAKLCDLGIAKAPQDAGLTQDGMALGTPRYISPEQARGLPDVDFPTDIYSLGASLYHMLAGVPPFDGPTPAAIMLAHVNDPLVPLRDRKPEIGKAAAAVAERMLAKEPASRYAGPEDLIGDLEALRDGRNPPTAVGSRRSSIHRRPTGVNVRRRNGFARSHAKWFALGGGVLAAILLSAILWPFGEDLPSDPNPNPGPPPVNEDKAAAAFRDVRALETKGDLEALLTAYRAVGTNFPGSDAARMAETEVARLQVAIAEAKEKTKSASPWAALEKKLASLPPEGQSDALAAFLQAHPDAPEAAKAKEQLARLKAGAEKPAPKKPEPPAGGDDRLAQKIAEAKQVLASGDPQKVERVLEAAGQLREAARPLAPEVERTVRTARQFALRRRALETLAAIDPEAAIAAARNRLADRNEAVRLAAIAILREKKDAEARPLLRRLVEAPSPSELPDPSPTVRRAAREALLSIEGKP